MSGLFHESGLQQYIYCQVPHYSEAASDLENLHTCVEQIAS